MIDLKEDYKEVFDIEYFFNKLAKCIGFLIGKLFDGSTEGNIDGALIKRMKFSGKRIPLTAYFFAIPVIIKSILYRIARRIKPVRKWYHKRMHKKLGCNYVD